VVCGDLGGSAGLRPRDERSAAGFWGRRLLFPAINRRSQGSVQQVYEHEIIISAISTHGTAGFSLVYAHQYLRLNTRLMTIKKNNPGK